MQASIWLVGVWAIAGYAPTELLRNGDFRVDTDEDGIADGWRKEIHKGAEGTFSLERDAKGNPVQRIDHTNESKEWVRASVMELPARPEGLYVVSVDVRATGPWSVILYQFKRNAKDANDYLSHHIGTGGKTGWKRISGVIRTTEDATTFKFSLITQGKGTAWFRDASLRYLGEPPRTLIPRVKQAPSLDGRLDEGQWKRAACVEDFWILDGKGKRAEIGTTARVFATEDSLCLAFECQEPQMAKQRIGDASGKEASWKDDSVELFVQPANGAPYYHVGITPAGGVLSETRATNARRYWANWVRRLDSQDIRPLAARAAARRGQGRWTAEAVISLESLGGTPKPGSCWRGNLVRSRKVEGIEQNLTWAYIEGETFHRPNRFGNLLFVGIPTGSVARIHSEPVRPTALPKPTIVPQPKELAWADGGPVEVTDEWAVKGPEAPSDFLVETVARQTGLRLSTGSAGDKTPVFRMRIDKDRQAEAYSVRAGAEGARLSAGSERGLIHAAATLAQLMRREGRRVFLWPATIEDTPDLALRCWHLIGPESPEALSEARRVIGIMAGLKYNAVCLQIDNRLQYERRPALSRPNPPTKQQLRALVSYAERLGMEVIPMTQCWSHWGYFLNKKEFAHLDACPKGRKKDSEPRLHHTRGWNYCPRHPEVHPIVWDMIEEQLECFPNAAYYHVGLDEISFGPIGEHPLTKDSPPHAIFAEEVNRLHEFIVKKKGLTMCMWGDQLLPGHNGGKPHFTGKAIDDMPRDILIFDWHYGASTSFPSVRFFKERGFPVVASGWYEPKNVYYLSKTARDEGVMGYSGTTWWRIEKISSQTRLRHAIPLAAENAWSCGRPTLETIAYRPGAVYDRLWPGRERDRTRSPKIFQTRKLRNRQLLRDIQSTRHVAHAVHGARDLSCILVARQGTSAGGAGSEIGWALRRAINIVVRSTSGAT